MIAVVGVVKDEADIIEVWLRHYLAEGIDHIYLSDGCSTDGTREIIQQVASETQQVTMITDDEPIIRQAYWTNHLADMAGDAGAEFIVASDIDEFFYAVNGQTIAEALTDSPHDKFYVHTYLHLDWDTRQVEPKRLPKVAYRYFPDARVSMGNHEVSLPTGEWNVLDLRELQFRGFDHYVRKVKARLATLDPVERARGNAAHYLALEHLSDEELRREWDAIVAVPVIADPIPTHLSSAYASLSSALSRF